ncbi:hypothetical protein Tco_0999760 [Tanacetum coccineum]
MVGIPNDPGKAIDLVVVQIQLPQCVSSATLTANHGTLNILADKGIISLEFVKALIVPHLMVGTSQISIASKNLMRWTKGLSIDDMTPLGIYVVGPLMSEVLAEQVGGGRHVWPVAIHGHYADGGESVALLSGALNVPMRITGHL